jgi:osmotically-inducible protein OsmY
MKHTNPARLLAVLAGVIPLLAGCSQQTLSSAGHDAQNDATIVSRETQRAARNAQPQVAKLRLGARVTAALEAADIHGVRVDAGEDAVSLHGTVDSADKKARAGRIARETLGPDKRVRNLLQVAL